MKTFVRSMSLFIAALFLLAAPVRAQAQNADALAAAHELIDTMKLTDQFKNLLPLIMKQLKPAIVQNRPEIDRDFDAIMPAVLAKFYEHMDDLTNEMASVYANNFTAAELHDLTAFYKTPTGLKLLQKTPTVMAQSMAAGQKFGQTAAAEARKEIIEQLRSKGHNI